MFFSYTQGEKTSHTGLKFCRPSPLHNVGQTRTHHSAKKSQMICKLINIDRWGGGRLANGIRFVLALLRGYSLALVVFMIYRAKLNGSWSAGLSHNFVVINQVAQNSLNYFIQAGRKIRKKLLANPPLRLQTT